MPLEVDNFVLRIFTPQGLVLEDYSSGVTLPAVDGEIGILPHHAKYVGMLGSGVLQYEAHPAGAMRRIVVSGGVCAFNKDSLTVLADRTATAESVDLLLLDAERQKLLGMIAAGSIDDPERVSARRELSFLDAVQRLVG